MDLSRRLAAGELTGLFGSVAAAQDEKARVFKFRDVARQALALATSRQRAVLDSYVRGVNAGLASLGSRPFEYWILRKAPREWRAEDSFLVVYAMWWDLQYHDLRREAVRREIDARLGGPVSASGWKRASCFLSPPWTSWDAPNESGAQGPGSPPARELMDCQSIPSPAELDIRAGNLQGGEVRAEHSSDTGSNNWAVAGALTASGGALVASDMHLGLRVPGVWYRARLKMPGLDLNGLTLPGAPVLVAGSNGHIAWSFSNSYGHWVDLMHRPCDLAGKGVQIEAPDGQGQCGFARWLATVPEATNLRLMDLETASSVVEAVALAPEIGVPHQNLIVGDRDGHIAWTIIGRIPRRPSGGSFDGASGWLTAAEQPAIIDPPGGRLWAANALATDDPRQQQIIGGDEAALGAGYDLGARARQVRDDLQALRGTIHEADMLAIQLDDRAVFLARWRKLLLTLLDEPALRDHTRRAELKGRIAAWDAHARSRSDGYWLVRQFRERVESSVWQMVRQALGLAEGASPPAHFEAPLWTLVTQRPQHLLAAAYPNWNALLLAEADAALADFQHCNGGQTGAGCFQAVRIQHPLSHALPLLAPILDMPTVEVPGDHNMPRVQDGAFGASERFAVTPGHEAQGYLHIAGGQSGHPLSPYYRAGFAEWARGKPLPFLPGPARHRLELSPR